MGREFPRWTPRALGTVAAVDVDTAVAGGATGGCRITARTLAILMVRCTCGAAVNVPVEAVGAEDDMQPAVQCYHCFRRWKACLTAFLC